MRFGQGGDDGDGAEEEEAIVLGLPPPKRSGVAVMALALDRTRDRKHKRQRRSKTASSSSSSKPHQPPPPPTYLVSIEAKYEQSAIRHHHDQQPLMTSHRMQELIHVALADVFGEDGAEAFSWRVFRFGGGGGGNNNSVVVKSQVRVCCANIDAFRAALALLVSDDGARLRVVECEVIVG